MKRDMEDSFEQRIALTLVVNETNGSEYVVSTVWLPVELYGGCCETMVFTKPDWDAGDLNDRYSSRSHSITEAVGNHNVICRALELGEYKVYGEYIDPDIE